MITFWHALLAGLAPIPKKNKKEVEK